MSYCVQLVSCQTGAVMSRLRHVCWSNVTCPHSGSVVSSVVSGLCHPVIHEGDRVTTTLHDICDILMYSLHL